MCEGSGSDIEITHRVSVEEKKALFSFDEYDRP